MSRPVYIFDLDGTLADIRHRLPLINLQDGSPVVAGGQPGVYRGSSAHTAEDVWVEFPKTGKWAYHHSDVKFHKNWDAFHAACGHDAPIQPMIDLMISLAAAKNEVWVWSGRMETVRNETIQWLEQYDLLHAISGLKMRPAKDHRDDTALKQDWLRAMIAGDRQHLRCVFEDRTRVVQMYRSHGVRCLQVAEGDF